MMRWYNGIWILLSTMVLTIPIQAQSDFVVFRAWNQLNHHPVRPDSIRIVNSQGLDTLITCDTFWMPVISGIMLSPAAEGAIMLGSCHPNPFTHQTRFVLRSFKKEWTQVCLYDLLGRMILRTGVDVDPGDQECRLDGTGLAPGIYFMLVSGTSWRQCLKITKIGPGSCDNPGLSWCRNGNPFYGLERQASGSVYTFTLYADHFGTQSWSDTMPQSGTFYDRELVPVTQAPCIDSIWYRSDSLQVFFTCFFRDDDLDLVVLGADHIGTGVSDTLIPIRQTREQEMVSWEHSFIDHGQYRIRVMLEDSMGFTASDSVMIDLQVPSDSGGWDPVDFDHVYEVGPGYPYSDPSEIPWETLEPSTLVRIHWREVPYAFKWVITTQAEADRPLVIDGIPDNGRKPVITGQDAVTRLELDYWNENRSVIKIGGSSLPADNPVPTWIYLDGLDICSARPGFNFTDDHGQSGTYNSNAAAVHIETGESIFIQNCEIHDCGNGIFCTYTAHDVRVVGNYIHDNGIEGSYYEHNTYTECQGIIYEYNRFGPLRPGCGGNNLKDRSCGTIIRYNWIEGGNRQLDLVETTHSEIANDSAYQATWVYGNILIEPEDAGNSQIIHYGGDGDNTALYRLGTLYFYHNTVISTRSGNTTLVRLSLNLITADIRNNIIYTPAGGNRLAITAGQGQVRLEGNWLNLGWKTTHESTFNGLILQNQNVEGDSPGLIDLVNQSFELAPGSVCIGSGVTLISPFDRYPVNHQYLKHQTIQSRPVKIVPDIGAFSFNSGN